MSLVLPLKDLFVVDDERVAAALPPLRFSPRPPPLPPRPPRPPRPPPLLLPGAAVVPAVLVAAGDDVVVASLAMAMRSGGVFLAPLLCRVGGNEVPLVFDVRRVSLNDQSSIG